MPRAHRHILMPTRGGLHNGPPRRIILWSTCLLLLLGALAFVPIASADQIGTSNVTFYPAGPPEVSLRLGESLEYAWVFYNGETASVYVNLTADAASVGLAGSASPSFVVLEPGGWGQIVLRLTAPEEGVSRSGLVRVRLLADRGTQRPPSSNSTRAVPSTTISPYLTRTLPTSVPGVAGPEATPASGQSTYEKSATRTSLAHFVG